MTRDLKHVIIYGAFGLLLGAKVVEVLLTRTDTSLLDWWLLIIGVVAAVIHYLPTTKPTAADEPDDTLVLRDPAHLERSRPPERDAAAAASAPGAERTADGSRGSSGDGFV
ncbi:hypothetical protein [Neolewinella maritima]|uniref:hypothetical protein n=1 Tax=Neolewinella maritima TaxID=1383882 RepID=UPI001EE7A900|nr:hypothetical protein [Neolewinella maritima]